MRGTSRSRKSRSLSKTSRRPSTDLPSKSSHSVFIAALRPHRCCFPPIRLLPTYIPVKSFCFFREDSACRERHSPSYSSFLFSLTRECGCTSWPNISEIHHQAWKAARQERELSILAVNSARTHHSCLVTHSASSVPSLHLIPFHQPPYERDFQTFSLIVPVSLVTSSRQQQKRVYLP